MENCMILQDELTKFYKLVNKLFIVCIDKKIKLVMENPYSQEHYLRRYWCYLPSIIDYDRTEKGDYFKKPTQYWFLNCEPKNNFIFEPISYNAVKQKDAIRQGMKEAKKEMRMDKFSIKTCRSMIHPQYANRFIREFILDSKK